MKELLNSYDQANYFIAGHGKRTAEVLKLAFEKIDNDAESDFYGGGSVIQEFQEKLAAFLGKDEAVFFPSGTMAQQIALRIWSDEKGSPKVAYHPLSHLEIHEEDGLKEIHRIETVLLADKTRVIEYEDVLAMPEDVSCLLLELPQREIGGQLPSFETLEKISAHCRERGIRFHLDGARLLEVLPFYEKSAEEICALFDSVYMSFYKGIGGIAGAILAGPGGFIEQSRVWRRRYGGTLISLYPYIIPADYYFELRKDRMAEYYRSAIELAGLFNSCYGVKTVPEMPVSNMFHVHFEGSVQDIADVIAGIQEEMGVGIIHYLRETGEDSCYFEVSLGDRYSQIPKEMLQDTFKLLDKRMKEKLGAEQ